MLVVFGIIAIALILFVTEPIPIDITAIGIIVALVALGPWTEISPDDGLTGFANPATITVLAMFVLSEGIRRTGVVALLSDTLLEHTENDPIKQLAALIGFSGGTAGFINNTPVVAIMIPMVDDIVEQTNISPSKLLIPISYASMMGGMLTVIGTSTNLLASDVSARLLDRPFTMFEFTQLGLLVLIIGCIYLLVIGRHLIPERITPGEDLTSEFEMSDYLTEVAVDSDSPLTGKTVDECLNDLDLDLDIVQIVRDDETTMAPLDRKTIRDGDVLLIRADRDTLLELLEVEGVNPVPAVKYQDTDLEARDENRLLVEVAILPDSNLVGETLESLAFDTQYDTTVLAIRRGDKIRHERMDELQLRGGDLLLMQATEDTITRLDRSREFVIVEKISHPDYRRTKMPIAVGIVAAVVAIAALEIAPIVITALAGIVAMVGTGCVRPKEVYNAVDWNVIFLLAGVIPLGIAMEQTGGAEWLASLVAGSADFLPPIAVLGVFYLFTALMTELISNNASVVLMIPVAVDVATQINANAFAFVLAVTFAASTAFNTPVGYQTNLMVYGPGGYKFTDFARVGFPLQLILTVVTTIGIVFFWGI
ncbi:SLC13 family permease [Natrinema soli]|uniref:SLC13 family permease n=1 Tax=Natrinema soli TaxID=1930624 RepID=A0ABD5SEX7_9EURY